MLFLQPGTRAAGGHPSGKGGGRGADGAPAGTLRAPSTRRAHRVSQSAEKDSFEVAGRGELQLAVLIENMRREGFELGVSRPEVILRDIDGILHEPFEQLVIDCEEQHQGAVMEELGQRRAELENMVPDGKGRVRLEFLIPSRGLIGFRTQFMSLTSGSGILPASSSQTTFSNTHPRSRSTQSLPSSNRRYCCCCCCCCRR